ncbi:TonB-dependent receptor [Nafulsella turpanensis]|uniref:TonB-dependent receptor n=1 Tax=Nafulsella turpanensis TaxID=1265690 RepID=UPI0003758489|nr:TonB-dependent receptor [Nafulsella turpanensis]
MKKIFFLLFNFLLLPFSLLAQYQLTGTVRDLASGEALVGATVRLLESPYATATDLTGHFKLEEVDAGPYVLLVTYVGYEPYRQNIVIQSNQQLDIRLSEGSLYTEEVIVAATRATENTPTTFTEVDREQIEKQNFGQDIPYLLNLTPSVVTTSDAGAGVGYTGMRIRGSDATRINVTVNGIPMNDAESHGVFWVNMPDFVSSVESIQIQRGVGTSTNGAAAFGATVNIQTSILNPLPYAIIDNSYGSFNTWKHTVKAGTGLINEKFAVDARLSKISSDGYIDRAFSDLKSFYVSGGYYGERTLIKANVFSGQEQTYQAWYGTPEELLETDRTYNYYTYENETDNYQQDHYQLLLAHDLLPELTLNGALHYTRGRGYYEQYREDDDFADYPPFGIDSLLIGSEQDTIYTTDLIRRRWLDNHFYGATWSADYEPSDRWQFVLGGGWNRYLGDHFGEIIWSQYAGHSNIRDRYYDNTAEKKDLNVYLKSFYQLTEQLHLFLDLQERLITYQYAGIDNDLRTIRGDFNYQFFNPKVGFTYAFGPLDRLYASYAKGSREPVRNDFIDAPEGTIPKAEKLHNIEFGYSRRSEHYAFTANYYLMNYKNQLVLTGELNDVGSSIRTNVDDSYRTGIELQAELRPESWLEIAANATFSRNRIRNFTEVLYNYLADGSSEIIYNDFEETTISFSPSIVAGGIISVRPWRWLELSMLPKYVGKQYLDNTQSNSRALEAYFVNDMRLTATFRPGFVKELNAGLLVNNVFNHLYESNGYTYGYGYEGDVSYYNYFYPQAGANFLLNLSVKL